MKNQLKLKYQPYPINGEFVYGDEEDREEFDLAAPKAAKLADLEREASDYLYSLQFNDIQIENLYTAFCGKFDCEGFAKAILKHQALQNFAAGGNLWDSGQSISEEVLFITRWMAGLKMQEALDILKFDPEDSNTVQDLRTGNIGTAQRWAKTMVGASLEDDTEMQCGRFTKPPRIAVFPNTECHERSIPITKRVDISSVCSHHFLPYGTLIGDNSYAVISYIPGNFVLGISKLQRLADWVARRPTIQEDLVKELWNQISKAAKTEDVYVGIFSARHTCEYLRGSQSKDGAFTTEFWGGKFDDVDLRNQVRNK